MATYKNLAEVNSASGSIADGAIVVVQDTQLSYLIVSKLKAKPGDVKIGSKYGRPVFNTASESIFSSVSRSSSGTPVSNQGTDSNPSLKVNDTHFDTTAKKLYVATAVTATTTTWTEVTPSSLVGTYWYCPTAYADADKELFNNGKYKLFLRHKSGTDGFSVGFTNLDGGNCYVSVNGRYNITNIFGVMTGISGNGNKFLNTGNGMFDSTNETAYVINGQRSLDVNITISGGGNQKAIFNLICAGEGNHEMRYWFGASL